MKFLRKKVSLLMVMMMLATVIQPISVYASDIDCMSTENPEQTAEKNNTESSVPADNTQVETTGVTENEAPIQNQNAISSAETSSTDAVNVENPDSLSNESTEPKQPEEPKKYTVKFVTDSNGKITIQSPTDVELQHITENEIDIVVEESTEIQFTVDANESYELDKLEVKGTDNKVIEPELSEKTYKLVVTSDLNVNAAFKEIQMADSSKELNDDGKKNTSELKQKNEDEITAQEKDIENSNTEDNEKLEVENANKMEKDGIEDAVLLVPSADLEKNAIMPISDNSGLVYNGKVTYKGTAVGVFTLDGDFAFCMEHMKPTPATGTQFAEQVYSDVNIRKVLYYGWGGAGQWGGFSSYEQGVVCTSLALSYYYSGPDSIGGNPFSGDNWMAPLGDFLRYIQSAPDAPSVGNFTLSPNYQKSYYDSSLNLQRTDNFTLNADSSNFISFTLPKGVELHNVSNMSVSSGNVTVHGGESFFLTAPLTLNETWSSGELLSAVGNFQAVIGITDGSVQNIGKGFFATDPTKKINFSVKWEAIGKISVGKRDSESIKPQPQGAATLKGAIYTLYTDAECTQVAKDITGNDVVLTTDENGVTPDSNWIVFGKYYLKETVAPEGYLLNPEIIECNLPVNEDGLDPLHLTVYTTDDIIRGDIQLTKFTGDTEDDMKKPVDGVTFTLTSKTTGEVFEITTQDGIASTKQLGLNDRGNLVYDTYIIHEKNTPTGLKPIDDFEVTISEEGRTLYFILEDKEIKSPITVEKLDETTGKRITAANTTFKITDADGKDITFTDYSPSKHSFIEFTTDENGQYTLPNLLNFGKYYLVEINAPNGYTVNDKPIPFEIDKYNTWENPITVTAKNVPVMGNIVINKTDKETGEAVAGAVFEVKAAEDIITADGTIRAKKGEIVDTVQSDASGVAKSKDLYLGKYSVSEKTPPTGYALNKESYNVELKYQDQHTPIVTTSVHVKNTPTTIIIHKVAKDDKEKLDGVKFKLWNKAMIDDETKDNIGLSQDYVTDKNGEIKIQYLAPGTYCFQETESITGFGLNDEIQEFTVDENGQIDGADTKEITVENDRTIIVKTTALDDKTKSHQGIGTKDYTFTDTVEYSGAKIGKEYELKASLMNAKTGEPILDGTTGEQIVGKAKFTAESKNGTEKVTFKFDASKLKGTTTVCFENLYEDGVKIYAHENLDDKDQTIDFPNVTKGKIITSIPNNFRNGNNGKTVKTGDNFNLYTLLAVAAVSLCVAITVVYKKRKMVRVNANEDNEQKE